MNKKPPELPNIEDATLRACLAPLMDAMNARGGPAMPAPAPAMVARSAQPQIVGSAQPQLAGSAQPQIVGSARPQRMASGSNDNPVPAAETIAPGDRDPTGIPATLAEWRSRADNDFAAFRMVEVFLNMTDAGLDKAVAEFPRQIAGTMTQVGRIKRRLAAQYDRVTAVMALLERAQVKASADAGPV